MVSLALGVAAFLFLAFVALAILGGLGSLIGTGFEQGKGCGCTAVIFSVVVVLVILAGLAIYFL